MGHNGPIIQPEHHICNTEQKTCRFSNHYYNGISYPYYINLLHSLVKKKIDYWTISSRQLERHFVTVAQYYFPVYLIIVLESSINQLQFSVFMLKEGKARSALQDSLMSSKPWECWKTQCVHTGSHYQNSTGYETESQLTKYGGLFFSMGVKN